MRWQLGFAFLLGAQAAAGENIDRIAVTVDRMVITESDVLSHLRVSAFLNGETADPATEAKRRAATRLVEQALIRREMEIARYATPSTAETEPVLEEIRKTRFRDAAAYQRTLAEHGLTEGDLRESLMLQVTILRFIDFRFRPSVSVTDAEVEQYYRDKFVPDLTKGGSLSPPTLEDSREDIEEILIAQRIDGLLDEWLRQAAQQARIRFREEAFR